MSVSWEPAAKGYTPEIDPELWKAETDAARGSGVFLGAIELDDGSYVYAVSRAMIAVPHKEIIGYFILTEEISVLQDTCSSMLSYPNQQYWITDQTGQIISSADPGQIGQSCRALFGDRAFETLPRAAGADGFCWLRSSCRERTGLSSQPSRAATSRRNCPNCCWA